MTSSQVLLAVWLTFHCPIIAIAAWARRSWTDLLGLSLLIFVPALILNQFLPPWGLVAFVAGHVVVPLLLRFGRF
jgi:hypothetical protein